MFTRGSPMRGQPGFALLFHMYSTGSSGAFFGALRVGPPGLGEVSLITVHHLNNSRSQRVLWLLEELGCLLPG